ncbi:hypothetical protein GCM10020256_32460 [Streptomyces thermocoprophilus]
MAAGAVFGSVQMFGTTQSEPKDPATRAAAAQVRSWAVRPLDDADGMPQCSYGAGKLLCAQSRWIYALDPANGTLLWRHEVPEALTNRPPVLSGGLVQPLTRQQGRLSGLDPASGKARWEREPSAYDAVTVAGGMLLLTGGDGKVTGVDGASGETRWSRRIAGHAAPFFVSFDRDDGDTSAYAATALDDGYTRVTAVDPGTGEVRWAARLRGALKPVGSAGGSVFFLEGDTSSGTTKAVVRYTPGTRAYRRVALPVPRLDAQASVHGDVVHVLAGGGSLEAVDMSAGRELWHLETAVSRGSVPAADDAHVFVTAADGRLLAVGARDGRLVGQTPPRMSADPGTVASALPQPVVHAGQVFAAAPPTAPCSPWTGGTRSGGAPEGAVRARAWAKPSGHARAGSLAGTRAYAALRARARGADEAYARRAHRTGRRAAPAGGGPSARVRG